MKNSVDFWYYDDVIDFILSKYKLQKLIGHNYCDLFVYDVYNNILRYTHHTTSLKTLCILY
jgi:hypothetical protein